MSNQDGEGRERSIEPRKPETELPTASGSVGANQGVTAGIKEELEMIFLAPVYLVRSIRKGKWPASYELDAIAFGLLAYLLIVLIVAKTWSPDAWRDLTGITIAYMCGFLAIMMMGCIVFCQVTRTKRIKKQEGRGKELTRGKETQRGG